MLNNSGVRVCNFGFQIFTTLIYLFLYSAQIVHLLLQIILCLHLEFIYLISILGL